jgi:Holliday junction DNA helicase RuvA
MIGRLSGKLIEKNPPRVLVDCAGVGYEVDVPMSTYYHLPEAGEDVVLLITMIIREDAHLLYGFKTKSEKQLFDLLLKVSGIGPRTALAMLSSMSPVEISDAIAAGQTDFLIRIPGIGKKTAERLVLELKDKVSFIASGTESLTTNKSEILQALTVLGFSDREAKAALKELPPDIEVSDGIRLALKQLSRKGA